MHQSSPQIHAVGPVYEGREESEPLLRDVIKVSTMVTCRDDNSLVGER